ncbi:unnamed protein product [Ectocarpus sp. CCAP 1310/34]|nr:unnamed protein product [Ectocarpus sp. CCAP 1310/34]
MPHESTSIITSLFSGNQPPSIFSQWTSSTFSVDGVENSCAEHFFAASKARHFGDKDMLHNIMLSLDPAMHKRYGRQVRGFTQQEWEKVREYIVLVGTFEKFSRNPAMPSPFDNTWGIGMRADHPEAANSSNWTGKNLLGKALQSVRDLLRSSASLPMPPLENPTDSALDNKGIHEINTDTQQPINPPSESRSQPTDINALWPSDAPSDYDNDILHVAAANFHVDNHPKVLAEHGPGLVDGIVTVDDASQSTKVRIHSGSATSGYRCGALLDSGSPATFVNRNALGNMRATGCATQDCVATNNTRSWGGFGSSQPLVTIQMPSKHFEVLGPSHSADAAHRDAPFIGNVPSDNNGEPAQHSSPPSDNLSPPTLPPQELLERLDAAQQKIFLSLWDRLPPHMRAMMFNLHGEGWTPAVIDEHVLHNFRDFFSTSPTDLGCCPLLPFKIDIPDGTPPVRTKPYCMNPLVAKQVDATLDKYLAAGLIQHSTSPYCSPIVVIPKQSGELRITVNYQKLNRISSFSQLPVPRVDEIMNKLHQGSIFSLFDFTGSFHQIPVHPDTIPLTAFATPTCLFEWLKMPMGASQSSGRWMKVINEVIKNLEGVDPYLDDVVLYDKTPADHIRTMRAFLQRLPKHKLKLSPPKATIGTTHSAFLGHTITPDDIRPNANKVAALAAMPVPTDLKKLCSLLGGLSYYRSFVTAFLKKNSSFTFTSDMEAIVREILKELSEPLIIVFPDWKAIEDGTRPLRLHCDASLGGLGATLKQEQADGSVRPIVFISRSTLDAERNWTPLDLEAGAIVWAIKRLRGYLRGTHFQI